MAQVQVVVRPLLELALALVQVVQQMVPIARRVSEIAVSTLWVFARREPLASSATIRLS